MRSCPPLGQFPVGPIVPAAAQLGQLAGASTQFTIFDGNGPMGATVPGSGNPQVAGPPFPISGFGNSSLIKAGPDNAQFEFVTGGALRYTGTPALFLIAGSLTVSSDGPLELDVLIRGQLQSGTGTITFSGVAIAMSALAVRKLNRGDVVELALRAAGTANVQILTLQLAVAAVGRT